MPYTAITANEWMIQFLDALQFRARSPETKSQGPSGALAPATFVPELAPGGVATYAASSPEDHASWTVSITMRYARQRTPVLLILAVNQAADLAHQFASAVGGVDRRRIRNTMLTDAEWPRLIGAVDELRALPIALAERGPLTTDEQDALSVDMAARFHAPRLLILDASASSLRVEAKLRSNNSI